LLLPLRGRHNLRNALAAVAVGLELGLPYARIAEALAAFAGVGRRCESHGEHGGVLVLDDYGHHPTEVQATMEVARSFGRRVAVLFQPHRYSRTRRFQREFGDALAGADALGLLPVYAASEPDPGDAGSDLIADALRDKGLATATCLGGVEDVNGWLDAHVRSGDLLLTLGAGDIGRLVAPVCEHLDGRTRP
jgi:UDP-N-acetylmuramate--alanine ligase